MKNWIRNFMKKKVDVSEQMDILFIGDMQRVQVNPGDVFVVTVPYEIPNSRLEAVQKRLESTFHKILPGHKVLMLSSGMKLGVLGSESKSVTQPPVPSEVEYRRWKSWKNRRPEHPQTEVQKLLNEIEYEKAVEYEKATETSECPDPSHPQTKEEKLLREYENLQDGNY